MLHYVDSQVGARAKLQCMSYVEFPGDPSRAVCTERGKWTLNAKTQCKGSFFLTINSAITDGFILY